MCTRNVSSKRVHTQTYLSPKIRVFPSPLWSKNYFSRYVLTINSFKNSTNSLCTAFTWSWSAREFRTNLVLRRITDKIQQGLNYIFSGLLMWTSCIRMCFSRIRRILSWIFDVFNNDGNQLLGNRNVLTKSLNKDTLLCSPYCYFQLYRIGSRTINLHLMIFHAVSSYKVVVLAFSTVSLKLQ